MENKYLIFFFKYKSSSYSFWFFEVLRSSLFFVRVKMIVAIEGVEID